MPWLSKKQCCNSGCQNIAVKGKRRCGECETARNAQQAAADGRAFYNYRWQRASKFFLKLNPVCVRCDADGVLTAASVTDHVVPHKGDKKLFWNKGNWQALCVTCHNSKTATEDGGFGRAVVSK